MIKLIFILTGLASRIGTRNAKTCGPTLEIKDKEIIVLDGQFHEDYDTLNYGPRDTVFMLFCMARDEKNASSNAFRFKLLSSHAILVRQVRDWIKKIPGTSQNQLPVRGTLVFEIPDHGPTRPMWFMR